MINKEHDIIQGIECNEIVKYKIVTNPTKEHEYGLKRDNSGFCTLIKDYKELQECCEFSRKQYNSFIKHKMSEELKELKRKELENEFKKTTFYKFLIQFTPFKRGKVKKTLERICKFNGDVMKRREFIEKNINVYSHVKDKSLVRDDGVYIELTKTECDYFKFLKTLEA